MPGRNGYEVAQHIKSTPRLAHIPVVLLTGAFEPIDQARAAAVGCDGVLAKPFEPQLVIGRVKELLARRARRRQARRAARAAEPPSAPAVSPAPGERRVLRRARPGVRDADGGRRKSRPTSVAAEARVDATRSTGSRGRRRDADRRLPRGAAPTTPGCRPPAPPPGTGGAGSGATDVSARWRDAFAALLAAEQASPAAAAGAGVARRRVPASAHADDLVERGHAPRARAALRSRRPRNGGRHRLAGRRAAGAEEIERIKSAFRKVEIAFVATLGGAAAVIRFPDAPSVDRASIRLACGFPKSPRSKGSKPSGCRAGRQTGVYRFDRSRPRAEVYLDRHAAADRQRIAARRPRVLVHAHRRHRALPADARQGGVLSDGLGRQRPADRAPRAELLRRALRSVAAVRSGVRAAGHAAASTPISVSRPNFIELCNRLTAEDEKAFEQLWKYLGPVGRLVDDLRDDRPRGAARLAARVPAPAEARPGLSGRSADALGRRLQDRGRAGRARRSRAGRRLSPHQVRARAGRSVRLQRAPASRSKRRGPS